MERYQRSWHRGNLLVLIGADHFLVPICFIIRLSTVDTSSAGGLHLKAAPRHDIDLDAHTGVAVADTTGFGAGRTGSWQRALAVLQWYMRLRSSKLVNLYVAHPWAYGP
jgi:hypothetical protein